MCVFYIKPPKQLKKTNTNKSIKKTNDARGSEIVKYQPKSNYTFGKFLSQILVLIINLENDNR